MYLNLISISNVESIEKINTLDIIQSGNTINNLVKPNKELFLWACHTISWTNVTSTSHNNRWSTNPNIYPITIMPTYQASRLANFLDYSPKDTIRSFTRITLNETNPSQIVALKITLKD